jgi:DNA polymerase-4
MFRNTPQRTIVHLDLDSFFVSVECLKNTSLRGRAVIVGGSSDRGVVAACSYEARRFGIHSAMPMKLARRLCPQVLIISGDFEDYSRYSKLVTEVIADRVPLFERASIDEFYVDLTGMDRFFGCGKFAAELKAMIKRESGLPVSYALSSNKLVSKVGTDESKPDGRLEIAFGTEKSFLAPLAVQKLPMIGKNTGELLRRMGVETIRILSEIPVEMLQNLLGKNGRELWRRANGIDESPVVAYHEQKGISTETTFDSDTIDISFMRAKLARMVEKIGFELRNQNRMSGCITIKLRYSNFDTVTRQATIPYSASDHFLLQKAKELFTHLYDRRLLVRLLGIRFSHLVPGNYQVSLFDDTQEMIRLYQSIDHIKKRFGTHMIMRAEALGKSAAR